MRWLALALLGVPLVAQAEEPFRLHERVGLPWLRFGLEHRSRVEHLQGDYRRDHAANATAYSMRTLLSAEVRASPLVAGVELEDARTWVTSPALLNTTLTNPLELLQAYAGLRFMNLILEGDSASFTLGRQTLDFGSRRLLARNEFRNTINGFTGAELRWAGPHKELVRAFAVVPVTRLPNDADGLVHQRVVVDRENTDTVLWGALVHTGPLVAGLELEVSVLGLHERDGVLGPTANRQLVTPALRLVRPPAPAQLDLELELMGQAGTSRASTASTDTRDLLHLAAATHASVGVLLEAPARPRVALVYDSATGDRDPTDGANERFDPLFGARRFDFGPTGLFGPISRTNLSSPGLRVELEPHRSIDAFAAWRLVWLASARDEWPNAGLHTSSTGRFVGQLAEARVRWHVLRNNLLLELGGALLTPGQVTRSGAVSGYLYTQLTGTL